MSATNDIHKVVIAGAGFAGLSAAIALARLGKEVTVLERSDRLAYGASITIVNRGPDALRDLGILDEASERGFAGWNRSLYDDFFDEQGGRRPTPPMPIRTDDGLPSYIVIYRPVLAEILSAKAADHGATIRLGVEVTGMADHGDGVTVTLSTGETLDADLLIAADGWRSAIRDQIFPGRVTSTYSGNMSMRWVKRNPPEGPEGFYVNDRSGVVVVHNMGAEMVYIATGIDMENRRIEQEEAVRIFREILSEFPAPYIQALRETVTDDDEIVVRPYVYHNMPAPWHAGRILVVGDAAHTMSAHIASGGVMALEDGIVLGEELEQHEDLDEALLAFAKRRARRTFVAVDACRQMLDLQVNYQAHPRDLGRVREGAFRELLNEY
ncbi:FAD-dependent oxidoreductase [Microbacterium sp.]|uniref:FAD-dependent oxidoreductase n=1 Tax=Microbacterium sp. TaxID=51671 RepID=UPI003A92570A